MTTPQSPASRRIRSTSRRVAKAQAALNEALADRNAAFAAGREEGMRMRQMAALAGVTTEAVAKVLRDPAPTP